VLELADELGLSENQRAAIRGLFDSMKSEAIPLGERLIAQEAALDRLFAARTATAEKRPRRTKSARRKPGCTTPI
jgi:hypothetical protein